MRLYNDKCEVVLDQLISDGVTVDAVIMDPPYKLDTHGGGNRKQWKNIHNNFISDLSAGFDYESIFAKLLRVCPTNNILTFCSNKQLSKIMTFFEDKDLSTTCLAWWKENYCPFGNGKHLSDVEFIVFVRGKGAHWNNDLPAKLKSKIIRAPWRIPKKVHPTQKSVEVMEHLVKLHTLPGDTVLDPYMGSGSTGIACQNLGRKFIGIELNEQYYEIGVQRLKENQERLDMLNTSC